MQSDPYRFIDKCYLNYKNENKGYKIFDEIEIIRRQNKNYYAAIDSYTYIYGISFGITPVEVIKNGKSEDLYRGYIQYGSNCIIKELRGTEYKDQPFDYSDRETCYSRIILKVLSELKSAVEYCDEEEKKKYWKYTDKQVSFKKANAPKNYKFFTNQEANYIIETFVGTNTIRKNRFEEEFFTLHYDELIKGKRGKEWLNDAIKNNGLSQKALLEIKVKALNHGIGCLNYFETNEVETKKKTFLNLMRYKYGFDNIENYIRLLHYIILSDKDNRITDLEKVDLMIDELSIILNIKNLKEEFNDYIIQCTIQIEREKKDAERLKNRKHTILMKDIITNQSYYNKIDETPRSILFKHICNDSYAYDYMENYINLMLTDEKYSKNIIKDKEFFLVEYASYLASNLATSKPKYTDKQAKELQLAINNLEIIDVYLESNKQISPLIIKKATSDQDKISCFITILELISDLDSKRFIAVREKLKDVWRYNNLIDSIQTRSLLRDDVAIRNTDVLINEIIVCLETQKKSLEEYEKDRENLINEIIAEINSIINKTKKNDIIEKEEEKENILFNQEDKYNYDFITKELEPCISGGTPSVYKSIIEKKVLPKGAQKLRAKTIKKADIYRFSKCFDLTIPEINKIFEEEIMANNKPNKYVNDFFRVLKKLNPDFKAPK